MNPRINSVLKVARNEIGTRERPRKSNKVKYNRAYYQNDTTHEPWCVVFQWWCFQKAGLSTSVFPKSASVFAVRDWYKARNRFDTTPRVGSLVIFKYSHIGIVEKVLPGGKVRTIEGNTDDMGSRTGGRVMRKIRSKSIQGYCHPDYGAAKSGDVRSSPARPVPARRATPTTESLYTSVVARNIRVPAKSFRTIRFTVEAANEGNFWKKPKDGKGGVAIARGGTRGGLFAADITLDVSHVKPGSLVLARFVEADPADGFKRVHRYAAAEFRVNGGGTTRRHAATTSRLQPGRHLWVQVYSPEEVVLPWVKAEVVFLRKRT